MNRRLFRAAWVLMGIAVLVAAGCGRKVDADSTNSAMSEHQKAVIAKHKADADSQ